MRNETLTAYYIVYLKTQYHMPNGLLIFHFFIVFDWFFFLSFFETVGCRHIRLVCLLLPMLSCYAYAPAPAIPLCFRLYSNFTHCHHRRCHSLSPLPLSFSSTQRIPAFLYMQWYFVCSIDFDTLNSMCVRVCLCEQCRLLNETAEKEEEKTHNIIV